MWSMKPKINKKKSGQIEPKGKWKKQQTSNMLTSF